MNGLVNIDIVNMMDALRILLKGYRKRKKS